MLFPNLSGYKTRQTCKTLKQEEVYLGEYRTPADVEARLSHFIEKVYNRKRLHSALGYWPPIDFEELMFRTENIVLPWQTALTASV